MRASATAAVVAGRVACARRGCTVEREQPNLVGQDIRLTVIHTSDIHSRLFPYNFVPNRVRSDYGLLPANAPFGGIARIATIVKRERARRRAARCGSTPATASRARRSSTCSRARPRCARSSLAGMDGAVVGNHEFDLGAKNLFEQIDNWAAVPAARRQLPVRRSAQPGRAARCATWSSRTRSSTSTASRSASSAWATGRR